MSQLLSQLTVLFQNQKKRIMTAKGAALLLALVLLLILFVFWQRADSWAHAKLEPYLLQVEMQSSADGVLHVQYDYGYGFIREHVQALKVKGQTNAADMATSISHWKTVRQLRLSAPELADVQLSNIRFQLGDKSLLDNAEIVLADNAVKPFSEISVDKRLALPILIRAVQDY